MHTITKNIHVPVLLDAVLHQLAPNKGDSYLDVTAGYGGHASAVLAATQAPQLATLVDRDPEAVTALHGLEQTGVFVLHSDFYEASKQLVTQGKTYDMILADLGVSSPHLDKSERGFAFMQDGPLDMRMDQTSGITAAELIQKSTQDELEHILRVYGEERRAHVIAAAMVRARPFASTTELAEVIRAVMPKGSRMHPATKSFQALRIAVNEELTQVSQSIPLWLKLLKPKGRLAIISFHSLEDRIVKRAFAEVTGDRYDAQYHLLTKHPVVANDTELAFNPRARSAKLRALQRK